MAAKITQKAGELNLTIEQGATFDLSMTWEDSEGQARDLTGYTARMQIRDVIGSANLYAELTTDNEKIRIDDNPATGKLYLHIPASETETYDWYTGVYDLELVTMSGEEEYVVRLLGGKVTVSKEVTIGLGGV